MDDPATLHCTVGCVWKRVTALPRPGAAGLGLNLERKVGFKKDERDKKVLSRPAVFQCRKSELRASDMNKDKWSQGLEFRVVH